MGGYVALSLIARYPQRVRALMLMDTRAAADSPEAAEKREELAQAVLAAGHAGPAVEAMTPRLFTRFTLEEHPERVAPMRELMRRNTARGIVGVLRAMARRPDRRAELPAIRVPTLVLVGEEDVITPPSEAQALADAVAGSRFEVIPEAGHLAPYENHAIANSVLLRFLDGLPS
jgi:pimeloyl-ACP methyl ester carboxylesterase